MASPCRPERPTLPWSGRRAARAWRDRDSRARRSLPAGRPRPRSSDRAADFIALELVGPDPGRVVPQALDRLPAEQMLRDDLADVGRGHRGVPGPFGVDHHHRSIAALGEAAGVVDPDSPGRAGLPDRRLHGGMHAQSVAVHRGAPVAPRAHEYVSLIDGHDRGSTPRIGPKVPGLVSPPQPYYPTSRGAVRTESAHASTNGTHSPARNPQQ